MKISFSAKDAKTGMTAAEINAAMEDARRAGVGDTPKITARIGWGGQITQLSFELRMS